MNIAIFSPGKNPYSETFIQAHKHFLKGNVFYYYNKGSALRLEKYERELLSHQIKGLKLKKKLLGLPKHPLWAEAAKKSLKAHQIDVILVEYGHHAYRLLPLLEICGIPFVVHFHGFDASADEVIKQCDHYHSVFERASKIIAVSKVMGQKLLDLGCPEDKILYNTYGPNPDFESVKAQLSKQQFIAMGRFTEKKAPYYTILAFKKVLEFFPEVKLLMAGDGDLLSTCQNLVRYYKLEKHVMFLGVVTPEEFRELLSESLAFVQHSITAANGDMEGTPVVILEASASGLPVISTHHAGIPEVILHEETGLLCEEHDVDAMAENMLKLLRDRDYAMQLGRRGKERIKNSFSMGQHISLLQETLENVVN